MNKPVTLFCDPESTEASIFWLLVTKGQGGECWTWRGSVDRSGYGRFNHVGRTRLAHRIAWTLANGCIPPDMHVLHKCDNPPCCNPEHLFLGTQVDNNADRDAKGRRRNVPSLGEAHGMAKLTDDQVRAILASKGRHVELCERFGVDRSTVGLIRNRKIWRHIDPHIPAIEKRHGPAVLTKEQVIAIANSSARPIVLAKEYGVTGACISQIQLGHTWRDVTGIGCMSASFAADRRGHKIDSEQATEIASSQETTACLAARFGVSKTTINKIKNGKAWHKTTNSTPRKNTRAKKLTESDVRDILKSDKTTVSLAAQYRVSTNTIMLVRKRATWKHLVAEEVQT